MTLKLEVYVFFLVALAVLTRVTSAHAVLTLFDNRPLFEAALGPHELITFEEFPVGPVESCTPIHPFIPDPCVFTTQGVTFTATQGLPSFNQRPLLSIDMVGLALSKGLTSNAIPEAPDQFFLTFSHPLLGIGFEIITSATFGTIVHVIVTETDGSVTEIPIFAVIGAGTFFGATSDIGIRKVSLFDPPPTAAAFGIDNIVFPPASVTVLIDIFPNSINLKSRGVVTAAILSSPTFDAPVQVNPETLTLAGASVKMPGKSNKLLCHTDDVNGDGLQDLVCHFLIEQFLLQPGDSTAVLEGETFDGTLIRGEDSVNIVPFKQGIKVR